MNDIPALAVKAEDALACGHTMEQEVGAEWFKYQMTYGGYNYDGKGFHHWMKRLGARIWREGYEVGHEDGLHGTRNVNPYTQEES